MAINIVAVIFINISFISVAFFPFNQCYFLNRQFQKRSQVNDRKVFLNFTSDIAERFIARVKMVSRGNTPLLTRSFTFDKLSVSGNTKAYLRVSCSQAPRQLKWSLMYIVQCFQNFKRVLNFSLYIKKKKKRERERERESEREKERSYECLLEAQKFGV